MDMQDNAGFPQQPDEGNTYTYHPAAQAAYKAAGASPYQDQAATPGQQAGAQPGPQAAPQYQTAPQQPQQPAPQPNKKRTWIIVAAIVAAVVLCFWWMGSCTNAVVEKMVGTIEDTGVAEATTDSVAIINLSGEIAYDGSDCSPEGFKELLDRAEANKHVRAVVLRVNSGGGTATAGEEMTEYLKNFSKPVVVSSAAINASAAYEISSQADYIYVAKSTAIGSLGAAMQVTDYSQLMKMLGINIEDIVSSEGKDSSYGTRPLTDEERAQYQHQVDQICQVLIENVAEGRGMTVAQVKELATGLTFTGIDAVSNGLADQIGTLEDACDKAAQLAGMTSYDVTYMTVDTGLSLSSLLSMNTNVNVSASDFASVIKELS